MFTVVDAPTDTDTDTDNATAPAAKSARDRLIAAGFTPQDLPAATSIALHRMLSALGFADFPAPVASEGRLPDPVTYAGTLLAVAPTCESYRADGPAFDEAIASALMPKHDRRKALAEMRKAFSEDQKRRRAETEATEADTDSEALSADPPPWDTPVDGEELFDDLHAAVLLYVGVPRGGETAAALWLMFAHTLDAHRHSPRLAVTSPTPACGKSTMLALVAALVPRALAASNITTAATFRAIKEWSPTLVIDEADTFLEGNEELRGVLNAGHSRATAFVVRTVGDDHTPRRFPVWSACAIALIGGLPATLESRAIILPMRRLGPVERVEPLHTDPQTVTGGKLLVLHRKLARWAADNLDALRGADPAIPQGFSGRRADNWRPLFAIADRIGGAVPAASRAAAFELDDPNAGQTIPVQLLADTRSIFKVYGGDRVSTGMLMTELHRLDGRPWAEFGRGARPITAGGIAKIFGTFGVSPRTIRTGGDTAKGYLLRDFDDAFGRYLPEDEDPFGDQAAEEGPAPEDDACPF